MDKIKGEVAIYYRIRDNMRMELADCRRQKGDSYAAFCLLRQTLKEKNIRIGKGIYLGSYDHPLGLTVANLMLSKVTGKQGDRYVGVALDQVEEFSARLDDDIFSRLVESVAISVIAYADALRFNKGVHEVENVRNYNLWQISRGDYRGWVDVSVAKNVYESGSSGGRLDSVKAMVVVGLFHKTSSTQGMYRLFRVIGADGVQ